MTKSIQSKFNTYIGPILLIGSLLSCGAVYIYGLNLTAVHTIGMEELEDRIAYVEEQLYILDINRSEVSVGASLEKQAEAQSLYAAENIHYISRDSALVLDR